jgi:hypothetical protein
MNKGIYYCERTKHRKIFAETYWGHFKCELDQQYIDNRNEFVEELGIKSSYKFPKYMYSRFSEVMERSNPYRFDHIETYKTKDNKCVIVNSPYHTREEDEKALQELGFVKYKPLYGDGATTYILITHIGRT